MKMKNEDVILDSNVLIAFFNAHDSLHEKSATLIKQTSSYKKVITDLVFAEIGTVLLMKTKQTQLIGDLLRDILTGKAERIQVAIATKQFLIQTLQVFSQQQSPHLSFEDCSIIALARSLKIKKIATFDKALRKMFATEFEFLPKNV